MGQAITSSSECHINILTDDALIIIFSFVTLYERLMVMRVSKRYHRILSNPQVWTHVDFWKQQQLIMPLKTLIADSGRSKTWMFPDDKESVLDFLKNYTSGSLKSIYLKVVSKDILTHLKKNCGNLEIISFISANDPVDSADISDFLSRNDPADTSDIYLSFPEIMPLPKTIKVGIDCVWKMGQVITSSSECHIDILTDDALIIIFSFLTLYERLMVMRVSKRCHRILSNPQVWTHVDFWQQQQLTRMTRKRLKSSQYIKPWMFPADKESVLDFLKKYTSGSLKSIYLKVVSNDILTHLKKNCSNLEIISFLSANDPVYTAGDTADISDIYRTCLFLK
ncbi:uncharacterized protein [Amphiura filiformis]|uniref:uncharacterized protein n=1 Tax=Amphiura filiformis TaxID=82378 RepID=UPI003B22479E